VKIMKGAFGEVGNWKQSHYSGLFSSFEVFLEREFLFILMGIGINFVLWEKGSFGFAGVSIVCVWCCGF